MEIHCSRDIFFVDELFLFGFIKKDRENPNVHYDCFKSCTFESYIILQHWNLIAHGRLKSAGRIIQTTAEFQRRHLDGLHLETGVVGDGQDWLSIWSSLKTSKPWKSLGMKPKNSLQIAIDGGPLSSNMLESVSGKKKENVFTGFWKSTKPSSTKMWSNSTTPLHVKDFDCWPFPLQKWYIDSENRDALIIPRIRKVSRRLSNPKRRSFH